MKKIICVLSVILFLSGFKASPERVITGTVSSDSGGTLPGVSVIVKGTKSSTTTDAKGTYSITVPVQGKTLVFSFTGMKTIEVPIGTKNVIDVKTGIQSCGIAASRCNRTWSARKTQRQQSFE